MTRMQTNLSIYVSKVDELKKTVFVQVKLKRLSSGAYREFVRFVFGECLTKSFLFKLKQGKREPCIFIFRLLSLYDTESSCAASI